VSTFQIVYSDPSRHQVKEVRCTAARQLNICLLSQPRSSLARQAVVMEGPFTSPMKTMANVSYMRYAAMIVAQQVVTMVSLLGYLRIMPPQVKIISNIHQLHVV
jgi:hypothetical protein